MRFLLFLLLSLSFYACSSNNFALKEIESKNVLNLPKINPSSKIFYADIKLPDIKENAKILIQTKKNGIYYHTITEKISLNKNTFRIKAETDQAINIEVFQKNIDGTTTFIGSTDLVLINQNIETHLNLFQINPNNTQEVPVSNAIEVNFLNEYEDNVVNIYEGTDKQFFDVPISSKITKATPVPTPILTTTPNPVYSIPAEIYEKPTVTDHIVTPDSTGAIPDTNVVINEQENIQFLTLVEKHINSLYDLNEDIPVESNNNINIEPEMPECLSCPATGNVGITNNWSVRIKDLGLPADNIRLKIDWGDSSNSFSDYVLSQGDINISHAYSSVGTRNILFSTFDDSGKESSRIIREINITPFEVAPSAPVCISCPEELDKNENGRFLLQFTSDSRPYKDVKVDLDWGDGSPIQPTLYYLGGGEQDLFHRYSTAGIKTISMKSVDRDGRISQTLTRNITIRNGFVATSYSLLNTSSTTGASSFNTSPLKITGVISGTILTIDVSKIDGGFLQPGKGSLRVGGHENTSALSDEIKGISQTSWEKTKTFSVDLSTKEWTQNTKDYYIRIEIYATGSQAYWYWIGPITVRKN
ncbi:MAG: hypothetical protein AABZ74_15725 [Cyanobacteriota bacterium]